jgi:hypothetical protein
MKTVIVLGNARSGTSMTAGILSFLGVNIDHEHKSNSQNPKGTFENSHWNYLTSEIYQHIERNNDKIQIKELYEARIKDLVKQNSSEIWGWKSALTHWSLDVFLPFVENPYLVIVTRNIVSNARSWQFHMEKTYNRMVSFEEALENMANSTNVLIKNANLAKCPKLWTTYENIKNEPLTEAEKMANFLDIKFDESKKEKIKNFIMPDFTTLL